jgi:hypothetical protein
MACCFHFRILNISHVGILANMEVKHKEGPTFHDIKSIKSYFKLCTEIDCEIVLLLVYIYLQTSTIHVDDFLGKKVLLSLPIPS